MSSDLPTVHTIDLGREPFQPVHERMLALQERIRNGASPGEVWLVEHEPVFTAGRATPPSSIATGDPELVPIERGGQITYHGPGQLVVYPIVPLPEKDIRRWLRSLEAFGVAVCAAFGLVGVPSVDGTGVFIGERKVASIGVAIRNWINLHGIAINVDMDLRPFFRIQPCGLAPETMSDLKEELGRPVPMEEAKQHARAALSCWIGKSQAQ